MPKSRSAPAKLSDAQLVILSAAAQRPDGSLLPLPTSLAAKGAALNRVMIEILGKRELAEERRIKDGEPEWRRDKESRPLGLFITQKGLLALGIDEARKDQPAQVTAAATRKRENAAAPASHKPKTAPSGRPKRQHASVQSKQDVVIQMLRRQSGVTIDDIIAKTGWQPHSVRGFFSGLVKKKLKLPLVSEAGKKGARRYHIAPRASAKA